MPKSQKFIYSLQCRHEKLSEIGPSSDAFCSLPSLGKVDKCQLLQQPLSLAMELNWEEKHYAGDCCVLQTLTPVGVHP